MTELDAPTLRALRRAFDEFKSDPRFHLQVKLRRYRIAELQELLTHPEAIDLDTFNREIWRLETFSEHNGHDITGEIYQGALSEGDPIDPDRVIELDAALDAGEIRFQGNSMWGSGARVYGSMLKVSEEEKVAYIRQALQILNDDSLSPIEKTNRIIAIPGFGQNIASGLVMTYHPDDFSIYNTPPKTVLDELGLPTKNLEDFQQSMKTLRETLDAQDFLELDWFLYLISQDVIRLETQPRFWWVNQGGTYSYERADGYIWAPKISRAGRRIAHHQALKNVQPGDVIFHYAQGALRSVSQVTDSYVEAHRPAQLSELRWEPEGYLVRTEYTELDEPIKLQDIPIEWRTLEGGPFTQTGSVKQGYLFPVTHQFAERLGSRYPDVLPRYVPQGATEQRVWIFQGNPEVFDIQLLLAESFPGDEEAWTVSRYESEMQAGDVVLIWQSGSEAGIYAIAELTGTFIDREPTFSNRSDNERAAEIRFKEVLPQPITREELRQHSVLRNLQILRSPQGSNFRVTDDEWQALQPLLLRHKQGVREYVSPSFSEIRQTISDRGLRLTEERLRQYHLALTTSRFVILAGNSGTGKTWLAQAYADAVGAENIIVPVAPNWTTNEDLLGYLNPIDGVYYDTAFSQFLRRAAANYQRAQERKVTPTPYHLILDEMNLARVEYYFARFLSAMEQVSRGDRARIELAPDDILILPPTLHFIGTVNVDETTHSFADKVYDRAQLIQLDASRELIEEHLGDLEYAGEVLRMWDAVQDTAPFSFRVIDQMTRYIASAEAHGVPWTTALDEQLLHKVLPKIKGAEPRVGTTLSHLEEIARDQYPLAYEKVVEMRDRFNHHGFTSFF